MIKKIALRTTVILLVVIGVLLVIPLFFQDQLNDLVKKQLDGVVDAQIEFKDMSLSLLKHFPNATVVLEELSVVNNAPFEGDTLMSAGRVYFDMSLFDLFKTASGVHIKRITIDESRLNLIVNEDGKANYDITKDTDAKKGQAGAVTDDKKMNFSIESYAIEISRLIYEDRKSEISAALQGVHHKGSGDFSADKMTLSTVTSIDKISYTLKDMAYINEAHMQWDALLDIDFNTQTYSFNENRAQLNDLELVVDGFIQINDDHQFVDLRFEAPDAAFKSLLSLIPSAYTEDFAEVESDGTIDFKGFLKGENRDKKIPKFSIDVNSTDASFKFPSLPEQVSHINLKAKIANETGKPETTFVKIEQFDFTIKEDQFSSSGMISNLTDNATVDARFKGTLNLENLSEAYPVVFEQEIKGIVKADFRVRADQKALENKQYERVKSSGNAMLLNMVFNDASLKNPVLIDKAAINFDSNTIQLKEMKVGIGKTDMLISGKLTNLLGYLFEEQTLKAKFNVYASYFDVGDVMVLDKETEETAEEQSEGGGSLKIPALVDGIFDVRADKAIYENLNMTDVTGQLIIKDEQLLFNKTSARMFEGKIGIEGLVSTKDETPVFDLDLGIDSFNLGQSFKTVETFQYLSPVSNLLDGTFNTVLNLKGNLKDDLSVDMLSLTGDALAQLMVSKVNSEGFPVMDLMTDKMQFIDSESLNLKDLQTKFSFEGGRVNVAPLKFSWNDIPMEISGSHGLDKSLDYKLVMEVPAKFLGVEASRLISSLSSDDQEKITVPLNVSIGGLLTAPEIKPDMKQAITSLSQKIVSYQKNKLLGKGTKVLGQILGGAQEETRAVEGDTTKVQQKDDVLDKAQNVLKGLFKKKKKK